MRDRYFAIFRIIPSVIQPRSTRIAPCLFSQNIMCLGQNALTFDDNVAESERESLILNLSKSSDESNQRTNRTEKRSLYIYNAISEIRSTTRVLWEKSIVDQSIFDFHNLHSRYNFFIIFEQIIMMYCWLLTAHYCWLMLWISWWCCSSILNTVKCSKIDHWRRWLCSLPSYQPLPLHGLVPIFHRLRIYNRLEINKCNEYSRTQTHLYYENTIQFVYCFSIPWSIENSMDGSRC